MNILSLVVNRAQPSPLGTWEVVSKAIWGGGFEPGGWDLMSWGKYGIHGTSSPHLIGSNVSGACIRMNNRDVEDLYKYVKHGTPVAIIKGIFGPFGNGLRTISPEI